ncbi:co-chaperone DjlA [Orbus wheelerorum]|uniref:co-chaperone DjlA n=1 Tax=Orbus wheelerorum TaxID=3074111 RepID=UPI00370D05C8
MSFIWAIVTAMIFSYLFKSGWLFLLGLFVGPMLYRAFNQVAPVRQNQPSPTLFLTIAFEVLGHLSKAKGQVTQYDINIAQHFMDDLQLDPEKRKLAQDSFNRGKSLDYPLQDRLNELYEQYRSRRKVLNIFCETLIKAAISDGSLHEKEEQILYIVAQAFRIPRLQMSTYIQMMMASYQFQQGQQYQNNNQYRQQGYHKGSYQNKSPQNDINNAYKVLGVESSADNATIKRAYRKLMNEHHPDKLVSKGLPKEMLEAAKKRAQEIQIAYDLIKAHKGFK